MMFIILTLSVVSNLRIIDRFHFRFNEKSVFRLNPCILSENVLDFAPCASKDYPLRDTIIDRR